MTRIRLAPFSDQYITDKYVGWLNDVECNRYLECRRYKQTIDTVRSFYLDAKECGDRLFAIIDNISGLHIGNVLVRIDKISKRGDVGLLIGEKEWRGKGIGTEVLDLVCSTLERENGIRVFTAGCYETNQASLKAFSKSGWKVVGTIKDYWYDEIDNQRVGQVLLQK